MLGSIYILRCLQNSTKTGRIVNESRIFFPEFFLPPFTTFGTPQYSAEGIEPPVARGGTMQLGGAHVACARYIIEQTLAVPNFFANWLFPTKNYRTAWMEDLYNISKYFFPAAIPFKVTFCKFEQKKNLSNSTINASIIVPTSKKKKEYGVSSAEGLAYLTFSELSG